MEEITFDLVGKVLEEDIVSELNILLLKRGTVLTETNILQLKKHNYKKVNVSENVSFKSLYLKHIKNIESLFSDIKKLEEIDINEWFEQDKEILKVVQKDDYFFEQMYNIHGESTLFRHSANVGFISFLLGKLLRYSYKNKLLLWKMGVLHDIGKMQVSSELLTKNPSEMTENDLLEYKQHPQLGWAILKNTNGVNAAMLNAAWHHHERIDGTGYPKGINVKYLPVIVQIVSVANKIDHLFMASSNTFEIMNELIEETHANKLNPAIVLPFVRHLFRNYVGKQVILNDNTKGEIMFVFDNEPSQPLLYVKEKNAFIDLRNDHRLKIMDFSTS